MNDHKSVDSSMTIQWQELTKKDRIEMILKKYEANEKENSNTVKEDLILEYAEHFNHQFEQLFPMRAPLMLSPKNEFGMRKFISTYIKPTVLKFSDLYDCKYAAEFVFHYVTYEPLAQPLLHPSVVVSPAFTLICQKGDCFDVSLLLVSLLIGCGYNAYCVSGFAKKNVTQNDQTVRDCPEIPTPEEEELKEHEKYFKYSKYKLPDRVNLNSSFKPKEPPNRDNSMELNNEVDSGNGSQENAQDGDQDKEHGEVHCWVLVLPPNRDVKEPFFIECSTGEILPIEPSCHLLNSYLSIESVWNQENYWVNMQQTSSILEMNYDLSDLSVWENVFIPDKLPKEEEDDDDDDGADLELKSEDIEGGELDDEILDLPGSWVRKIDLSKEQHESKYPCKEKQITYKNAKMNLFADYHLPDLLVKRQTIFKDHTHSEVVEIHCYYSHRKDLLDRRSIYFVGDEGNRRKRVHEWFSPGRQNSKSEGLSEIKEEEGVLREFRFYSEARLDGLERRVEYFSEADPKRTKKVIEMFKERPDRLCYRSVRYDVPSDPSKEKVIVKMTEKFTRNQTVQANEDVAKRTFYVKEGRTVLWYHYDTGKITRVIKEYGPGTEFTINMVDHFMKKPKPIETYEESKVLAKAESHCEKQIRNSEAAIESVIKARMEDEKHIMAKTSVYDTLRNRSKEKERRLKEEIEKKDKQKQEKKDILAGFLQPGEHAKDKEHAKKIYFQVLGQLRKRLMARANIIYERLKTEKQNMSTYRQMLHKNQDSLEKSEAVMNQIENLVFKIDILKSRFEAHKAKSREQFEALRKELLADPRLSLLEN